MRRPERLSPTAVALSALALAAAPVAAQQPVEVTVRSPDASPVREASVEIVGAEDQGYSEATISDAGGVARFEVPGVAATYRLVVSHEDWARYETTIDVPKPRRSRVRTVEVAVTLVAKSAPERFNLAIEALRDAAYDEAETYLREAVELDPALARAWGVLALVALRAERWEDAVDASGRAIGLDPADVESLRARHEALTRLGRSAEAEIALDGLVEHDTSAELARRLFNSGAEAANRGDNDLARRRFGQALDRDSSLWQAHAALAEVAIAEHAYDDALAALDAALALVPGQRKIQRRRVDVLRAAGRAEEADAAAAELGD